MCPHTVRRIAATLLALCALTRVPCAQCLEWTNELDLPGLTASPSLYYGPVLVLEVFDDGTGPKLVAGGSISAAGGTPTIGLAMWDGSAWSAMDPLLPGQTPGQPIVFHIAALFADGADLYVGGETPGGFPFGNGFVSRLGSSPAALGMFSWLDEDTGSEVRAIAKFGSIYAAGRFEQAGTTNANSIARYTGSGWAPLGLGLELYPGQLPARVRALVVFDDGNGEQLYAAGDFRRAGGIPVSGIARWSGTSWSSVGSPPVPIGSSWSDLIVFDDGSGIGLVGAVGGKILRFDGSGWSIVSSTSSAIHCLAAFDDGTGTALYAGGAFTSIDGVKANRVAKWNGASWSALGGGITTTLPPTYIYEEVRALASYDDGSGAALFAAGSFDRAGGDVAEDIAAWRPCTFVGTPYCFGDGSLATPCPCAPPSTVPSPSGAPDAGCANSVHASGAKLFASGATNPDTVRLHSSSQTSVGFSLLVSGNGSDNNGVAYGDGVRCAGGTFVRFGAQNATGGTIVYPNVALGFTHPLHIVSSVTPGSGQTRYYQGLYRDAAASFCNAGTFNLTSAVSVVW